MKLKNISKLHIISFKMLALFITNITYTTLYYKIYLYIYTGASRKNRQSRPCTQNTLIHRTPEARIHKEFEFVSDK